MNCPNCKSKKITFTNEDSPNGIWKWVLALVGVPIGIVLLLLLLGAGLWSLILLVVPVITFIIILLAKEKPYAVCQDCAFRWKALTEDEAGNVKVQDLNLCEKCGFQLFDDDTECSNCRYTK